MKRPNDVPSDEDADSVPEHESKKKHKDGIDYEPRRGITIRSGKTRLRIFMGAETVIQEGHCVGDACGASDALSFHVRRARLALEAKMKHHLSIDFAIQVKNEVLVLKAANFSWKHHWLTLKAGFLKPPGGMERDSSTWVKPFPERSVVANFKQDRIIGVMATQWASNKAIRIQEAAGHPPAGNFDAFEPEDVVLPPPGIEPEDLTTDPGNWDVFLTGTYVPNDNFEFGLNATVHTSPDAGRGPNFAEPYETRILQPRFIKGTFAAGGFDTVWHNDHVRASAELVVFHSGETIPHLDDMGVALEPTSATHGEAGYAVVGFTPCGHYGRALDNAPLLDGWQWLVRGEFLHATPGVREDTTAKFGSVTTGIEWQVEKQLRLQVDVAVQKYNAYVDPSNTHVWRIYSEIWGQVLL